MRCIVLVPVPVRYRQVTKGEFDDFIKVSDVSHWLCYYIDSSTDVGLFELKMPCNSQLSMFLITIGMQEQLVDRVGNN